MRRSRPGANLKLAPAAPLTSPACSCTEPEPITTGDGKRRCLRCAGTVEAQERLDVDRGGGMSAAAPVTLAAESVEAIAERVAELLMGHGSDRSPELIDAAEVARRLSITRGTVYEHADELGAIRVGDGPRARLRFDPGRVAAFMGAGRGPDPADRSHSPTRKAPRRQAPAVPLLEIKGSRS